MVSGRLLASSQYNFPSIATFAILKAYLILMHVMLSSFEVYPVDLALGLIREKSTLVARSPAVYLTFQHGSALGIGKILDLSERGSTGS